MLLCPMSHCPFFDRGAGRQVSSSSSSRVYYARENGSHRAGGYAKLPSLLRYSSEPPKRAPLFLPPRLFSSPACLTLLDRPARRPISPSVQQWLKIATATALSHFRDTREILNSRVPRTYRLPCSSHLVVRQPLSRTLHQQRRHRHLVSLPGHF
ncbi:hypothetical protein CEP54_016305 [Fusarium duplospermum]|uniref:Uncharacterized protein n=1 Tax=Fusarium duplospermum TaxID=1325734 RepID=A0A428NFG6_9HYPO|nr:hypothetical protein CEP54_016305 [Fusarium duplospermum]